MSEPSSKLKSENRKKRKYFFLIAGFILYPVLFLPLIPHIGISVNYLVIIPIVAASYCFGLGGGIVTGSLGLTMNLGLFSLRDSLFLAPDSLVIAQVFGMVVGTGLGLAGSYFEKTEKEIAKRLKREDELKEALAEKEVLYRELNHRVKNNLTIIKSLIQLQIYRSKSREFIEEGDKLVNRILSISLVHEQLYSGHLDDELNLREYLKELTQRILESQTEYDIRLISPFWKTPLMIAPDKAITVGLIINEVVTNSIKYAFVNQCRYQPEVTLLVEQTGESIKIRVDDNGSGFFEGEIQEGLGSTLIKTLTSQLNGVYAYVPLEQGIGFTLTFPR